MRKKRAGVESDRVPSVADEYGGFQGTMVKKRKMARNSAGVQYGVPPRPSAGAGLNPWHHSPKMEPNLAGADGSHYDEMLHNEVFGHEDGSKETSGSPSHKHLMGKFVNVNVFPEQHLRASLEPVTNNRSNRAGLRHSPAGFFEEEPARAFPKEQIDLVGPVTPEMPPSSSATFTGTEAVDHGPELDMVLGAENERTKEPQAVGTESDRGNSSRKSRLDRNRESARVSRHKKKKELNDLEEQNKSLRLRVEQLKTRKDQLTRNRDTLKRQANSVSKVGLQAH